MTQICIFHLLEIMKNCRMTGLMEVGNWDLPEGNQGCICVKELTNTYPRFAAKSWSTNRISLSFFNIKVCFLEKKIILFPYSLLFLTKTIFSLKCFPVKEERNDDCEAHIFLWQNHMSYRKHGRKLQCGRDSCWQCMNNFKLLGIISMGSLSQQEWDGKSAGSLHTSSGSFISQQR